MWKSGTQEETPMLRQKSLHAHCFPDFLSSRFFRRHFFRGSLNFQMSPTKFIVFDVRPNLAKGEEPLPLIRARVYALTPGHGVTIVAPFMPAPLIELLKSEGFQATMERRHDGGWAVNFWKD